jgi:PmbA protein
MIPDLLSLAEDAVKKALAAGASAADGLAIDRSDTEIALRHGVVEKLERSEARELGLRVFAGQSSATICGSVLDGPALARMAERAVAMARLAPPDPHAGLAGAEQLATRIPDLDLADSNSPGAEDLKAAALAAESAALSVKGVTRINSAGASHSARSLALVTSAGFARGYARTSGGFSVSAIAGDGTGMERDYDYTMATHWSDLDAPEKVGRMAGERAVRRLAPRKVSSRPVPVIFDRRVAASLLGHLSSAINGHAVARGTSFLKDKMGQRLFAPGVTVVDDPLKPRGAASRPFDGEGLATMARQLIQDGSLTGWLLDLHAARQLGLAPTGNGARGLTSPPSPTSSNLTMLAGTVPVEDMVRGLKEGLLVTELIGTGANLVTGDYSRGATGFWIENGEIAYPVSEVTIAGNLLSMFAALTPANDLVYRGAVNAPSCLVEGLTLAGR